MFPPIKGISDTVKALLQGLARTPIVKPDEVCARFAVDLSVAERHPGSVQEVLVRRTRDASLPHQLTAVEPGEVSSSRARDANIREVLAHVIHQKVAVGGQVG